MTRKAFAIAGLLVFVLCATLAWLAVSAPAALGQSGSSSEGITKADFGLSQRPSTGGAQTLADILARQQGLSVDDDFRRNAIGDPATAAPVTQLLGTLGGASDADVYRALRFGSANVTSSDRGPTATMIIQDSGMRWLLLREGPLIKWGGFTLLITLIILAVFFVTRGRIRLDGQFAGRTVLRFKGIERFSHWLLAISFVLLGISGLVTLMGRKLLIPLVGREVFAPLAQASKWIHNNVAWAFMIGLVLVLVLWVRQNIPGLTDLRWLARGGGLLVPGSHPPARKFNAGQKIVFWAVIIMGISISMSGLALLYPFELPLFAKTFAALNATGLPELLGMAPLPEILTPYQEIQLSQIWHAIVAFAFMAIILAHIYLGSIGMQGAFQAMGSGKVDEQWAREHHSLWLEELSATEDASAAASSSGAASANPPAPSRLPR